MSSDDQYSIYNFNFNVTSWSLMNQVITLVVFNHRCSRSHHQGGLVVVLDMSLAVLSVVANLVVITSIRFDSISLNNLFIMI